MTSKKELFAGPKIRKSNDPPSFLPEPGETVIRRPQEEQLHEKLLAINNEVQFKVEPASEPLIKEQVEDQVLEAVQEAKEDEWVTRNKRKALLSGLRKLDDKHNRTCSKCLKRLPIDKFRRHERSEMCEDCED